MKKPRTLLLGILTALLVAQGVLSQKFIFPQWKRDYSTGNLGIAEGLTPDQLLASLSGLRTLVAGILWVKTDEYFHNGQFDAVVPLVRLVTWLDPRQEEVYATGAWHIAYNFTDEQNRSDRRYIPLALRLLQEGVQYNQNHYRLFHETGWLYYHKIDDDYDKAVKWFEQSVSKPGVLKYLRSILASAYQRDGRIEDALVWYAKLEKDAADEFAVTKDPTTRILKDTQEKNLNNHLIRMTSRGYFGKKAGVYDKYPYDTHNPVNLNFTFKVEVVDKKVIRVTGTWGIPTTGARVRCVLRDADYNLKWEPAPGLDFDIDRNRTFMLDPLYTQNGRFDRRIDMSRNPTMYGFKSDEYVLEFYFSPRSAPPHIQDKIGWNGEGMTDRQFIDDKVRPGQRVLFTSVKLTRDQILRRGEYRDGYVYRSPGYKEVTTLEESDVIFRGSMRN
ncbi:MAG: tetratricopeptide repeat protein [Armatimonadetes bacterium]|nr:tetratricopeptide repeat protein [Armatimonadota bacterium]NOG92141.1 tetratricopeptide repeat protein [Armatimonadota bacterium]